MTTWRLVLKNLDKRYDALVAESREAMPIACQQLDSKSYSRCALILYIHLATHAEVTVQH